MKKIFAILIVVAGMTMTSCKKKHKCECNCERNNYKNDNLSFVHEGGEYFNCVSDVKSIWIDSYLRNGRRGINYNRIVKINENQYLFLFKYPNGDVADSSIITINY